ncbi:MAG: phage tail assembly chaperone [Paludibacteraceae bacterium]
MNKRDLYKDFEFGGRNWRIGKFDAMTGSYIAYKLMAELLPMGIGQQAGIPVSSSAKPMSKADFMELQRDCLLVCEEMLPAGPAPVIDKSGNFGVVGLEHDVKIVMALTIQVLVWNITSFFDESLLTSLSGAMSSLFQLNAKT